MSLSPLAWQMANDPPEDFGRHLAAELTVLVANETEGTKDVANLMLHMIGALHERVYALEHPEGAAASATA